MAYRDMTLAHRQMRDVSTLTDSSGGTASDTLAAQDVALTGVDGTGSNAAPLDGVNAELAIIRNSLASLAAKLNTVIARQKKE